VAIIAPVHNDVEIETAINDLGREPRGGLVVMPNLFMLVHRAPIILAAARNNVPAIHAISDFARDGGLLSYGPNQVDNLRHAASYVDRILRGAKRASCPSNIRLNSSWWSISKPHHHGADHMRAPLAWRLLSVVAFVAAYTLAPSLHAQVPQSSTIRPRPIISAYQGAHMPQARALRERQ
jgi:hypothetical protein